MLFLKKKPSPHVVFIRYDATILKRNLKVFLYKVKVDKVRASFQPKILSKVTNFPFSEYYFLIYKYYLKYVICPYNRKMYTCEALQNHFVSHPKDTFFSISALSNFMWPFLNLDNTCVKVYFAITKINT